MARQYEKYKADTLQKELNTPDAYMQRIMKKIKLNELYDVLDYYYTSDKQNTCPVLIKIENEDILDLENNSKDGFVNHGHLNTDGEGQ